MLLDIVRNETGMVYVQYLRGKLFEELRGAFGLLLPSEMLPTSVSLFSLLARTLSYIDWEIEDDIEDSISLLLKVILPEADAYKKKTGKPFVLIIDDINKMLLGRVDGKSDLHKLQLALKIIADSLVIHVVLVDSAAGGVVSHLSDRSDASRMEVVEVGDIDREKSIYLLSHSISEEMALRRDASEVYELITGGRLLIIWKAVKCIRAKAKQLTIESLIKCVSIGMRISHHLKACGLTSYNESSLSWMLLKDLLVGGDVSLDEFNEKYNTHPQSSDFHLIIHCLIDNDIVYQNSNLDISLYSALTKTVLMQKLRRRGITQVISQNELEHGSRSEKAEKTGKVKLENGKSEL
ncbi:uncharacterized protein [Oscarella lobularis]|uniref:uncharacterized protein n=1 Tax=Oscarella lobularis TaxID=121494 RepID=UPI003313BD19